MLELDGTLLCAEGVRNGRRPDVEGSVKLGWEANDGRLFVCVKLERDCFISARAERRMPATLKASAPSARSCAHTRAWFETALKTFLAVTLIHCYHPCESKATDQVMHLLLKVAKKTASDLRCHPRYPTK